ncbi:hypothetical protein ABPG72_000720 [Tetrahymena utriculariae]
MNTFKNMGLDCERNSLNVSELLQYNAHSIDEEDEISYENQNENLKTEDDENNQNEQRSDSLLTERKYFKENNSVQVKSENIVYLNSQINSIHLSSISFDYLNPSSYDNSSSDISRSPSPLKQSRMGGFSPEAKRKSSKGFLKISIPLRKQSLSNTGRKTYHDKYTTLEKIGQGSLGLVSRCRCVSTQKEYAVKTIGFKDGEHLLNISREFFLLQSLKHPNVVRTYDLFIENKKCYIILDYVVGFSLQDYLEKHQKMSEEYTKFVIIESLKAIQYLHQKGICHRDITSNNILIDEKKNSIKLIDFSNSKTCDFRRMMTKTGTLRFMAPEIFKDQEYDKQVDMWSLGIVMFQLLTGQPPFYSANEQTLINDIQKKELDISQQNILLAHLSTSGIDFLSQILQKNPRKRLTPSQALCHPWLKQVNLMCQFKKFSKKRLGFSSKSPMKSRKSTINEMISQELASNFSINSEQQNLETHSTYHNLIEEIQVKQQNIYSQALSQSNLDCLANENQESGSFEEQIKINQISICEENQMNSIQDATKNSPNIIPISINSQIEKNTVLTPCNRFTNSNNPQPQSPPNCCAQAQKFSNNNDTNFNSKAIIDQNLDIRKRSRSSIYYSQILS